jgi:hypothetical protein
VAADNLLVNASQEADMIGVTLSRVSRVRSEDPQHPANQPGALPEGRSVRAPADAVRAYWAALDRTPGPAPTAPHRRAGLTPTQWAGLQSLAAGGTAGRTTRGRLAARGLIDDAGQLTDAGRSLLAQHATDGTQPTET